MIFVIYAYIYVYTYTFMPCFFRSNIDIFGMIFGINSDFSHSFHIAMDSHETW